MLKCERCDGHLDGFPEDTLCVLCYEAVFGLTARICPVPFDPEEVDRVDLGS